MRDADPRPKTSPLATVSLLCGLGALLGSLSCGILAFIPGRLTPAIGSTGVILSLISGIVAIITGHLALAKIKQAPGNADGYGFAINGRDAGYLNTVLTILILVLATPAINASKDHGSISQNVRRARILQAALFTYANDHNGNFPPDLAALEANGSTISIADTRYHDESDQLHDWTYHPGLRQTSPFGSILLAAPEPDHRKGTPFRIVVRVDGGVTTISESQYQSLLSPPSP